MKMKEASSSLIKKQLERSEEKVKKRARFFNSYLSQKKDEPKVRIYKNMDRNVSTPLFSCCRNTRVSKNTRQSTAKSKKNSQNSQNIIKDYRVSTL